MKTDPVAVGAADRVVLAFVRGRERARAVLRRYLPNESQHLFALTLAVGVVCGFAAVAFHLAIKAAEHLLIDRAMHARGWSWMAWTVASPTLGGLFVGAVLTWVVPGARGSGIPQVKQAFASEGGRVRFRDAFGKFWLSALQIGSGASLGREGPTVQICAGAASMLARATALPPRSMRRLTPVGVAAGIAAAFNAPIAAVTFTIEEIVGSLDQTVLSGVVVAAALAAVIERSVLGIHPVIEVKQPYGLEHPTSLVFYALLGVLAAGVSIAFSEGLLGLRLWFRRFRALPPWAHPSVGGFVTGLSAVLVIRFLGVSGVTGGGYETLGRALAGGLGLRVLLVLCVVKTITTLFSYSSGGAGGIFAPSLFVGAMLGGTVGHLDVFLLGHERTELGAFALVGMGAVFAGVIRAPITSVLIIFEMTGGYGLVLPLMLASTVSYAVARHYRPVPIYEALLEQDGVVLPREAPGTPSVKQFSVADVMTREVVSVPLTATLEDASSLVDGRKFALLPVTGESGRLRGVVQVAALRARVSAGGGTRPILELVQPVAPIRADLPLLRAAVRMNEEGVRQLVVVDPETETLLVGVIAMTDLVRAHARAVLPASGVASARVPGGRSVASMRAVDLRAPARMLPGSAKLEALVDAVASGPAHAGIVSLGDGEFGVVIPGHLSEIWRDRDLHDLVIAADVARPVPRVREEASFSEVVRALSDHDVEAVVVESDAAEEPTGVVTRDAVSGVLLRWYLGQTGKARGEGRGSGPALKPES